MVSDWELYNRFLLEFVVSTTPSISLKVLFVLSWKDYIRRKKEIAPDFVVGCVQNPALFCYTIVAVLLGGL